MKVINITLSEGHSLLGACEPLYEYSWFISKVRDGLEKGQSRDEAIAEAIRESIGQGMMADFLKEHSSEVRNMLFTEFNLEDAREVWEEEAMERGLKEGRENGLKEGREEGEGYGLVKLVSKKLRKEKCPEEISEELEAELGFIRAICEVAKGFAPTYDPEAIFNEMRERKQLF